MTVLRLFFSPAVLVCLAAGAQAEIKTFTREMRRAIGENQSRDGVRLAAIAVARRLALEEAGVFMRSLTVVRNLELAEDRMMALATGVAQSRVIHEKPFLKDGIFGILVVVEVTVNTDTLEAQIKKQLGDRRHLAKLVAT